MYRGLERREEGGGRWIRARMCRGKMWASDGPIKL